MISLFFTKSRLAAVIVAWQLVVMTLGPGLHGIEHHDREESARPAGFRSDAEPPWLDAAQGLSHSRGDCAICRWLAQARTGFGQVAEIHRPLLLEAEVTFDQLFSAAIVALLILPRAPPA